MKKLIIDASTKVSYVGIYDGSEKVDENLRVSNNDHSKFLTNIVMTLLEDNGLTPDDLDEIIVGIGPGSYTGVRVAVTIAKVFGFMKDIKVKTISSLILLSSGYTKLVLPTIDARRGQVFSILYENNNIIMEEGLYIKDDLLNEKDYSKALMFELNEQTINVNINNILNFIKLEEDIHLIKPNYLRRTEAERNRDKTS